MVVNGVREMAALGVAGAAPDAERAQLPSVDACLHVADVTCIEALNVTGRGTAEVEGVDGDCPYSYSMMVSGSADFSLIVWLITVVREAADGRRAMLRASRSARGTVEYCIICAGQTGLHLARPPAAPRPVQARAIRLRDNCSLCSLLAPYGWLARSLKPAPGSGCRPALPLCSAMRARAACSVALASPTRDSPPGTSRGPSVSGTGSIPRSCPGGASQTSWTWNHLCCTLGTTLCTPSRHVWSTWNRRGPRCLQSATLLRQSTFPAPRRNGTAGSLPACTRRCSCGSTSTRSSTASARIPHTASKTPSTPSPSHVVDIRVSSAVSFGTTASSASFQLRTTTLPNHGGRM